MVAGLVRSNDAHGATAILVKKIRAVCTISTDAEPPERGEKPTTSSLCLFEPCPVKTSVGADCHCFLTFSVPPAAFIWFSF